MSKAEGYLNGENFEIKQLIEVKMSNRKNSVLIVSLSKLLEDYHQHRVNKDSVELIKWSPNSSYKEGVVQFKNKLNKVR
jgi:hypothetical protein